MKSLVFLLSIVSAAAQVPAPQTQSCPVTLKWFGNADNKIHFRVTNTADQDVTAIKYHVEYVDSWGKPLPNISYSGYEGQHDRLRSHKEESDLFDSYIVPSQYGWAAVQAIKFKDGSTWEDNGSLSCRGIDYSRWKEQSKKEKN